MAPLVIDDYYSALFSLSRRAASDSSAARVPASDDSLEYEAEVAAAGAAAGASGSFAAASLAAATWRLCSSQRA